MYELIVLIAEFNTDICNNVYIRDNIINLLSDNAWLLLSQNLRSSARKNLNTYL